MQTDLHSKDGENKLEESEPLDIHPNSPCRDILETVDITLEEVAIDGICGVY